MSGFLSHANNVIRNNRRKRIDKFKRIERYIGTASSEAIYKEASEYTLHKIKDNVLEQQRNSKRTTIIIFSIVGILLIAIMYYFLFVYTFPKESSGIFIFD